MFQEHFVKFQLYVSAKKNNGVSLGVVSEYLPMLDDQTDPMIRDIICMCSIADLHQITGLKLHHFKKACTP